MAIRNGNITDEAQVRKLIGDRVSAIRAKDVDGAISKVARATSCCSTS
jgi:hypothetical protein